MRMTKINVKEPCVAVKSFMMYRKGDRIKPMSYWRLRRWARRGWVENLPPETSEVAVSEVTETDTDDTPPVVIAAGGGWFTVHDNGDTLRYQGRTALEEAGYQVPDE